MSDWSTCPAVERDPDRVGGAWVFRGTRVPVAALFEKRGAVISTTGKTRISIYVDDEVLQRLRAEAEKAGTGYQTLINEALKIRCGLTKKPG